MEQRPAMETNSPPRVAPRPQGDNLLDDQKIGATLLICGVTLALVGVTYTTVGWQYYQDGTRFVWMQPLGPVLISVGGIFVLTSICKFSIFSCWSCRQSEEEPLVVAAAEQTSRGCCVTINGENRPLSLHCVTTTLCTPPPYSSITQEVNQAFDFQPGSSVSGLHAALPPHDTVDNVNNVAFTSGGDRSAHSTEAEHRGSRVEKTEDKRGCDDKSGRIRSQPPAYEDICPPSNKHNLS